MTFVITVIQDEDGMFVVECPAIPGLREPGADGCGGGGQHQGRHPRMSRGATRTGTAAHDRGARPGRLCRNIDGSNQATLLNRKPDDILQPWSAARSEGERWTSSPNGRERSLGRTCWISVSSVPRLVARPDPTPIWTCSSSCSPTRNARPSRTG